MEQKRVIGIYIYSKENETILDISDQTKVSDIFTITKIIYLGT